MKKPLNICIIGAGLMGHGIAQAFAEAGHYVSIFDEDDTALSNVPHAIQKNLQKTDSNLSKTLKNITLCKDLKTATLSSNLVIEAITEDLTIKQNLFVTLEQLAPQTAILASNTSVIPISEIGKHLGDQAKKRLVGTHWWNPPHLIPLVEIIKTSHTDDIVFESTFDIIHELGKKPVKVLQDIPGFIGNRLQHAMWREALFLVSTGVCDVETIDTVVKNSFGMRLPFLGPMENADLVGLNLINQVHQFLFPHLCNEQNPRPLIENLIKNGNTGINSGKGLQNWPENKAEKLQEKIKENLIKTLNRK